MKLIKVYIRIAKHQKRSSHKVAISTRPNPASLYSSNFIALPTIRFGVVINIPEDAFDFSKVIDNEIQLNVSNRDIE